MSEQDIAAQLGAARAEVDRLQEAFDKSAIYTAHLQVTRQDALAEVARLQAEVAKLRGLLPTWRRGSFGVTLWSLGVPNGDQRFDVWCYAGQWFWGAANSTGTPATDRDAAMRAAEAAAWLPQCEVVE